MSDEQISQTQVNKALRTLSGQKLKNTVRIHYADGRVLEFQSNEGVSLHYEDQARQLWIVGGYCKPIMPYEVGMIILTEENPK